MSDRSLADFAATLWPIFLLLIPLCVVGAVEQGAPLGWMALAFASVLAGGWMARKGGALV